jgi:hypothetical protein
MVMGTAGPPDFCGTEAVIATARMQGPAMGLSQMSKNTVSAGPARWMSKR